MAERTCAVCGIIIDVVGNMRTCSRVCAADLRLITTRAARVRTHFNEKRRVPITARPCGFCGEDFEAKPNTKMCSFNCRKSRIRVQARDARRVLRVKYTAALLILEELNIEI